MKIHSLSKLVLKKWLSYLGLKFLKRMNSTCNRSLIIYYHVHNVAFLSSLSLEMLLGVKTLHSLTYIMLNIKWLPPQKTTPIYFPCQLFWHSEYGSHSVYCLIATRKYRIFKEFYIAKWNIARHHCGSRGWFHNFQDNLHLKLQ